MLDRVSEQGVRDEPAEWGGGQACTGTMHSNYYKLEGAQNLQGEEPSDGGGIRNEMRSLVYWYYVVS